MSTTVIEDIDAAFSVWGRSAPPVRADEDTRAMSSASRALRKRRIIWPLMSLRRR
jgi:hypothetical protein